MPKPITITISGCPYSGKSTLISFLGSILPVAFSIQQDDFQISDSEGEPQDGSEYPRHDSFDLTALEDVIRKSQEDGEMPVSGDETNKAEAASLIPEEARNTLRDRLVNAIGPHKIGLVEGRTLHQDPGLLAGADVRLFLRASKAAAKEHCAAFVESKKSEGEESSFEETIWPEYVRESAFLFNGDDVEGTPNSTICELMDLAVQPKLDNTIEEILRWAVDAICFISDRSS